ncbi:MAG: lytic transglycosylase domain-containing protein [Bosea sp. (in: a-proteobacteria)]|uniref:lytic transglycosylase domain-containing protein n=1 Tax=Bosea sp. (in: a-proteobacteria) TaxID=1871050 RepID=UPI003F7B8768
MGATINTRSCRRVMQLTIALAITGTSVGTDAAILGAAISSRPASHEAAELPSYAPFVAEAAHRFDVPEAWLWAIIQAESHGDPHAVSPAGAMGLMQIMPETWRFERARLGLGNDPFDDRDNILAGADYLRTMQHRYGAVGMLAAYNAGPGRYEDFRQRGRPLPTETLAYVRRLAPVVTGGVADDGMTSAPPDSLAWTHAPLFAARPSSAYAGDSTADDEAPLVQSADGRTAPSSAEPTLNKSSRIVIDAPANGVFVALSGHRS